MLINLSRYQFERPQQQSGSFDLQYEICSKYMKIASDHLVQKQLDLMQQSSQFIDKLNEARALKDISTTQQSLNLEITGDQDDPFNQPSPSRLLLRKSQSNCSLRRTESGITQALRQVQRKCSQKTATLLTNMANDLRRFKEKISNSEKLQKELKKLQGMFQITKQQLILIRKTAKDLEEENKVLQISLLEFKNKLKDSQQQLKINSFKHSRVKEQSLSGFTISNQGDKLKKYLQEKQMHIVRKEKTLKNIQDKMQASIQFSVESGCEKCCQLVKKMKESILKYRSFLEDEATLAQALYNNFKSLLT